MIIAGGAYIEFCQYPYWRRLFGSGLRAALAMQYLSPDTELFTYAPPSYAGDVLASLQSAGLKGHITPATEKMQFDWLHPHQLVNYPNPNMDQLPILEIEAPAVLRFGMIEGKARVKAERAVYSVQNETEGFFENGSCTKELVVVATDDELERIIPPSLATSTSDRVAQLFEQPRHTGLRRFAVLVRNGLGDVTLYRRGGATTPITTYAAESYFKIGGGDVLASAFAHAWLEDGQDLEAAADRAARSLAWFVQDARLPLPMEHDLPTRHAAQAPDQVRLLGSESLEMGQLVVATVDWLERQKPKITVDLDDGPAAAASDLPTLVLIGARPDLSELKNLEAASSRASKRVVFTNGLDGLKSFFPGALLIGDYSTALYHLLRSERA